MRASVSIIDICSPQIIHFCYFIPLSFRILQIGPDIPFSSHTSCWRLFTKCHLVSLKVSKVIDPIYAFNLIIQDWSMFYNCNRAFFFWNIYILCTLSEEKKSWGCTKLWVEFPLNKNMCDTSYYKLDEHIKFWVEHM